MKKEPYVVSQIQDDAFYSDAFATSPGHPISHRDALPQASLGQVVGDIRRRIAAGRDAVTVQPIPDQRV